MYTYCLSHDTAYQCVVPDQPLHRWLMVSSVYKISAGDIEIYKILYMMDAQIPIF